MTDTAMMTAANLAANCDVPFGWATQRNEDASHYITLVKRLQRDVYNTDYRHTHIHTFKIQTQIFLFAHSTRITRNCFVNN